MIKRHDSHLPGNQMSIVFDCPSDAWHLESIGYVAINNCRDIDNFGGRVMVTSARLPYGHGFLSGYRNWCAVWTAGWLAIVP